MCLVSIFIGLVIDLLLWQIKALRFL